MCFCRFFFQVRAESYCDTSRVSSDNEFQAGKQQHPTIGWRFTFASTIQYRGLPTLNSSKQFFGIANFPLIFARVRFYASIDTPFASSSYLVIPISLVIRCGGVLSGFFFFFFNYNFFLSVYLFLSIEKLFASDRIAAYSDIITKWSFISVIMFPSG